MFTVKYSADSLLYSEISPLSIMLAICYYVLPLLVLPFEVVQYLYFHFLNLVCEMAICNNCKWSSMFYFILYNIIMWASIITCWFLLWCVKNSIYSVCISVLLFISLFQCYIFLAIGWDCLFVLQSLTAMCQCVSVSPP